jgi:hypothetical protein
MTHRATELALGLAAEQLYEGLPRESREALADLPAVLRRLQDDALLRLHAGAGSVEGLTTHLGLAAEVSEEVERLIAAHAEVERTLKFPRLAASTPS